MVRRYLVEATEFAGARMTVRAHPRFTRTHLKEPFFVEYDPPVALQALDPSLQQLPFLLNAAPLVWFSGEVYRVRRMDAELHHSFERIRSAYRRLFPHARWSGRIEPDELVVNPPRRDAGAAATGVLFTGGIDSLYSTLSYAARPLRYVCVHGADIALEGAEMWRMRCRLAEHTARDHGHQVVTVRSNVVAWLRTTYYGHEMSYWWTYGQHGLGLVGLALPMMYALGVPTIVMAATHTRAYRRPWGSAPDLEGQLRCAGVTVDHHGFDAERTEKTRFIVEQDRRRGRAHELIVCNDVATSLRNCCACEKCIRTIHNLLLEGADPRQYGFAVEPEEVMANTRAGFEAGRIPIDAGKAYYWNQVQRRAREAMSDGTAERRWSEAVRDHLEWLAGLDLVAYERANRPRRRLRLRAADWATRRFRLGALRWHVRRRVEGDWEDRNPRPAS